MKRRITAIALAAAMTLPALGMLTGCGGGDEIVLRVYNWEEYIDEGGEDSYDGTADAPDMISRFEAWYEETYDTPIRVEYSTFGTNEDMYNQLRLGDMYDLICPSEYMIMKLAAEGYLQPYSEDFFDATKEENYYIRNVSPMIRAMFESNRINKEDETDLSTWADYAAGYMWGVTGFTYNPLYVDADELKTLGWDVMRAPQYRNKVTTKDNVRDSYFVALAILYRDEIEALDPDAADYSEQLAAIMNRTDEETIRNIEAVMREMDENNVTVTRRDLGKASKRTISDAELLRDVKDILNQMQHDMYDAVVERNKTMIHEIADLAALESALAEGKVGFFRIKNEQTQNSEFEGLMEKYKISRRCLDDNNPEYVYVAKSY